MHWHAPLNREAHAESHVYTCTNFTYIRVSCPSGMAWCQLCRSTASKISHVHTSAIPTCTRVSEPYIGVFCTVQCVCSAIGIYYCISLLLFGRLLVYSRLPTLSKEDTKLWVLPHAFGLSVVAWRQSLRSLCDSPRAHLFPSIAPLFYGALLPRALPSICASASLRFAIALAFVCVFLCLPIALARPDPVTGYHRVASRITLPTRP